MRKWLWALAVVSLLALFIMPSIADTREAMDGYFVTNTSTRGIALDGDTHWALIHPRTVDVVVEVWNTVGGTAAKQYEFIVEDGDARVFQVSGMDSLRIVRATTTIVDYGLSTIMFATPSLTR